MFTRLFLWSFAITISGFAVVYFWPDGPIETVAAFAAAFGLLACVGFGILAVKLDS